LINHESQNEDGRANEEAGAEARNIDIENEERDKRRMRKRTTDMKPNSVHRMSSKPAAVTALRVLHNVQPLSPSNGVLIKALRVGKLAERNAPDEDKDVDKVEAVAFEGNGSEREVVDKVGEAPKELESNILVQILARRKERERTGRCRCRMTQTGERQRTARAY
jgi:hypothetical protein